jgi:5-(carboxyamino)imidazole ribonucleotide synthase
MVPVVPGGSDQANGRGSPGVGPPRRAKAPTVGIVGAGQLARMICEAASMLGIRVVVLAEQPQDPAAVVAHEVVVGMPADEAALRALAGRCDVVTFDHEQVDVDFLAALERTGVVLRPGTGTLRVTVDKAEMRRRLDGAGLDVPAFRVLGRVGPAEAAAGAEAFADEHGWPVVVKAIRGGYDGRGVWPVDGPCEARPVFERAAETATPLMVEEMVAIDTELAVVVARRPGGDAVAWPPVETAQVDGLCREVLYPGRLDPEIRARAADLGRRVATVTGAVGVLAVELFWTGDRLLVNELAARPHNSAHWTIEGAVTSQFENHLRAVCDLPLGETSPVADHVTTVNVLGGPVSGSEGPPTPGGRLSGALGVPGAHVHLYGKQARPGRKLGHVTVCGQDEADVRARAWAAARALGTPVPAGIGLPVPPSDGSAGSR